MNIPVFRVSPFTGRATPVRYPALEASIFGSKAIRKATKRPRDSQRQKFYDAEDAALGTPSRTEAMSLAECQAFVNSVVRSQWVKENFTEVNPNLGAFRVTDGRGARNAKANMHRIVLPKWARNRYTILHEIAHGLTPRKYAGHGREYVVNYLKLMRHFEGVAVHDMLRDSFKARGVKYKLKRKLSPETLAKLRERGRDLAAARKQK